MGWGGGGGGTGGGGGGGGGGRTVSMVPTIKAPLSLLGGNLHAQVIDGLRVSDDSPDAFGVEFNPISRDSPTNSGDGAHAECAPGKRFLVQNTAPKKSASDPEFELLGHPDWKPSTYYVPGQHVVDIFKK